MIVVIWVKMDQRVRTQAQGPLERAKGNMRKDQGDHPPWENLGLLGIGYIIYITSNDNIIMHNS